MGKACTPIYVSIIMGKFEQKNVFSIVNGKVDLYLRYINDHFFIWKGTEEVLKNLFSKIS